MSSILTASLSKSDELLQTLRGYDRILVVMHDNPDPDAIASGWGVEVLIQEKLGIPVRLVGGGAIVRLNVMNPGRGANLGVQVAVGQLVSSS